MNDNGLPMVSVCCQSYNQEPYIRQCLEGFIIQKTNFLFEVLIHDDASTDKTADIIREYEAKYPDIIKPIYQIENKYSKGISIFREFQYPKAKGKYIAICEGDDYWIDPLKLQNQVDFLEANSDYGLVWTDIDRFHQESQLFDKGYFKNDIYAFCNSFEDYLLYAPFRAPCTWLLRRSCIIFNHSSSYLVGDLPLFLDVLANYKIKKTDDVTAVYRVLKKSASHFNNLEQLNAFMRGIYNIQIDYANKYNVSSKLIETIKINYYKKSYLFAVALGDYEHIELADKLLLERNDVSIGFKIIILLARTRIGRFLLKIKVKLFIFRSKC